jgi:gamma-glutamyl:cysteine ligase YbdK (ATP-grasp superfamily)
MKWLRRAFEWLDRAIMVDMKPEKRKESQMLDEMVEEMVEALKRIEKDVEECRKMVRDMKGKR